MNSLRVGFDEQVLLAQRHGGISRYVISLITEFRADPGLGVEAVAGWSRSPNAHAIEAGLSGRIPGLEGQLDGPLALPAMGAYFLANTTARAASRRARILHHTYTHPRFRAPGFKGVRACTVYDMIPELFPESFPKRNPHVAKRDYVASCDLVLCISESTKRDLIRLFGDPGVPMPVVPLGVDPNFRPVRDESLGLPERYVLFIGRREGYKDFAVLAEAWAQLPDDGTKLLVVGPPPNDEERTRLAALGIDGRIVWSRATDSQLPAYYSQALAFAFPSRYEGFGLPTLEAMACGVPVVLADSSSHPEVGGKVARYFTPGDAAELAGQFRELLEDGALRADLGAQGVARAAGFTWAATARGTAEAYRSVTS